MDRTRVLDVVLREVSAAYPEAPLFAVEVGCMFSEEQGCSTSTIADSLAGRAAGGRLVTIDCDPDHILRARAMLGSVDAKAGVRVEFRQGFSTDILPGMLAANPTVHVAYVLPRKAGGKFHPRAARERSLVASIANRHGNSGTFRPLTAAERSRSGLGRSPQPRIENNRSAEAGGREDAKSAGFSRAASRSQGCVPDGRSTARRASE